MSLKNIPTIQFLTTPSMVEEKSLTEEINKSEAEAEAEAEETSVGKIFKKKLNPYLLPPKNHPLCCLKKKVEEINLIFQKINKV